MEIGTGTRARDLVELISMSGYATRSAAELLCGRSIRNIIPKMRRIQNIELAGTHMGHWRLLGSSDNRALTLSSTSRELLQKIDARLHDKYNHIYTTNPFQKERLLQISEVYAMMMKAQVHVHPGSKPVLGLEFSGTELNRPYYYDSIDIKALCGIKEMGFTRMRGILFCPSGAYITYFVNKELAAWRHGDESKMRHQIDDVAKKNFPVLVAEKNDFYAVDKSLVFSRKPGVMKELLEVQRTKEKKTSQNLIGGSSLYDKVHFLPASSDGIKILKLISYPRRYYASLDRLFGKKHAGLFDLMGMRGEEGDFYYPAFTNCISDLVIIRSKAYNYRNNHYKLYCLPWQLPYLRDFYDNLPNIELKPYGFDI